MTRILSSPTPRRFLYTAASQRLVLAFLGAAVLSLTGCASLDVRALAGADAAKAGGVRFYLPKPYLLVRPAPTGAGSSWEVIYLPDYDRAFEVSGRSFLSGVAVELSQGLFLERISAGRSLSERGHATSPPSVAPAAVSGGGALPLGGFRDLAPGLYSIETGGDPAVGVKLVRLEVKPELEPRLASGEPPPPAAHSCCVGCNGGAPAPDVPRPPAPEATLHFHSADGRTTERFVISFDDPHAESADLKQSEVLVVTDGEPAECGFGEGHSCRLRWQGTGHHRIAVGTLPTPAHRALVSLVPRAAGRTGRPVVAEFSGEPESAPDLGRLTVRDLDVRLTRKLDGVESVRLTAYGSLADFAEERSREETIRHFKLPETCGNRSDYPQVKFSRGNEDDQGRGLLVVEIQPLTSCDEPFDLVFHLRDRHGRLLLQHPVHLDPTKLSDEASDASRGASDAR